MPVSLIIRRAILSSNKPTRGLLQAEPAISQSVAAVAQPLHDDGNSNALTGNFPGSRLVGHDRNAEGRDVTVVPFEMGPPIALA